MKDLMVRGATLEVPPPSSGLEQMSKDKVIVAKKLPMSRYMWRESYWPNESFLNFKENLPITLVPLVDGILVFCASISKLLPPIRGDFFSSSNINDVNHPHLM